MQRQLFRSLARCATEQLKAGRSLASLSQLSLSATPESTLPLFRGDFSSQTIPLSAAVLTTRRGFAGQARATGVPQGAYQAPAGGAARGSSIRVTLISSNLLAEPYKGEPPSLPLSSYVTISGWKERWRRWMGGVKSIYTISKIKKNVTGWTLPGFKEEALSIYEEACEALAKGDRTELRQLVTPAIFTDMKRQIKAREDGGWKRVHWELVKKPTLKEIEVVQGRLISINPKR